MESNILQYQISDWFQLKHCKSNNCPELSIAVSEFMQNPHILGINVSVKHPCFGTLFSYTISPKGDFISPIDKWETDVMSKNTLLNELKRYGFYVTYQEEYHLPSGQINLLKTIQGLRFDKLRLFAVHEDGSDDLSLYIGAFDISSNPMWINPGYSPSRKEWESAILAGTAINLSGLPEFSKYNWDWIYNAIYDIDEIILRSDNE